jgi:hypothetical protein
VPAFFGGAYPEIIAYRAADIFLSLFSAVPFGLAGPVDLAGLAAVHLRVRHGLLLPACRQAGSPRPKIHHMDLIVNKIMV